MLSRLALGALPLLGSVFAQYTTTEVLYADQGYASMTAESVETLLMQTSACLSRVSPTRQTT
jgi:hypothetical protein